MVSLGDKKYQKGKIYFIGNYIDNDIYIGRTTQTLKRRFQRHKDNTKNEKINQRKLYVKMCELGVEHFFIEEIEKCPCENLDELEKRERHYILERQPVLNIQIPQRTMEEWKKDNQEHLQEYERERYKNNPRKEYRKQYREDNKEILDKKTNNIEKSTQNTSKNTIKNTVKIIRNTLNNKILNTCKPGFLVEAGAPRREAFDDSSGPMTTEWLCHYDGTTTA